MVQFLSVQMSFRHPKLDNLRRFVCRPQILNRKFCHGSASCLYTWRFLLCSCLHTGLGTTNLRENASTFGLFFSVAWVTIMRTCDLHVAHASWWAKNVLPLRQHANICSVPINNCTWDGCWRMLVQFRIKLSHLSDTARSVCESLACILHIHTFPFPWMCPSRISACALFFKKKKNQFVVSVSFTVN